MTQHTPEERLSAYLDGELDAAESEALERELRSDPTLHARHEALSRAVDTLRRQGPLPAPADFHARVLRAVADEPQAVPKWAWLRRPFGLRLDGVLLAVAAAAVLWVALPVTTDAPSLEEDPAAARIDFERLEVQEEKAEVEAPMAEAQGEVARPKTDISTGRQAISGTKQRAASPVVQAQEPVLGGTADKGVPSKKPQAAFSKKAKRLEPANFSVRTSNPDAQYGLQRLVARYGGEVMTVNGARPTGDELSSGRASFLIRIPGDVLPAFSRDLDGLGVVQSELGDGLRPTDTLELLIVLEMAPASGRAESL